MGERGPFLTTRETYRAPMADMLVALLPVLAMSCYLFGPRALAVTLVSAVGCVLFEFLWGLCVRRPLDFTDLSAAVTGVLLAFCLPVTIPYWMVLLGDFFAIVVVKQLFGGLGKNFLNPALAAYALLLTFPLEMSAYSAPFQQLSLAPWVEGAAAAETPLSYLCQGVLPPVTVRQLLLGQCAGGLGEVSALMLLVGGVYLVLRRVISLRIPLCFLGTVAILTFLFPQGNPRVNWMLCQLLSGGLLLGAIFMATDYVTSPVTRRGQVWYGVGCGLLTVAVRYLGSYTEGVWAAILVMNAAVGLLDRLCMPRPFGAPAPDRLARLLERLGRSRGAREEAEE